MKEVYRFLDREQRKNGEEETSLGIITYSKAVKYVGKIF